MLIEPTYPWFMVGSFEGDAKCLQQGDLIPNLLVPQLEAGALTAARGTGELEGIIPLVKVDGIVLTQSCDLLNDKALQVIVAACFPSDKWAKDARQQIAKERIAHLHMIDAAPDAGLPQQVIDFRVSYGIPVDYAKAVVEDLNPRVRLLPPYREHLAQAYARFFMRVGLPRSLSVA